MYVYVPRKVPTPSPSSERASTVAHEDVRLEVRALVIGHARSQQVVPRRTVRVVLSRARLNLGRRRRLRVRLENVHFVRGVCVTDETRGHLGHRVVLVRDELERGAELHGSRLHQHKTFEY